MSFWTSHFPCLTFSFLSYKMEGLTENLDSKWSLKSLFSHCSSSFLIISCVKSRTFRAGALSPQSEQLHNQLLSWRGKPRSSERGTKFPMLPVANPCLGSRRQVIENQAVPLRALCLSWSHRMPLYTGPPSHLNPASKDMHLCLFCALHQNHKYPTNLSREELRTSEEWMVLWTFTFLIEPHLRAHPVLHPFPQPHFLTQSLSLPG